MATSFLLDTLHRATDAVVGAVAELTEWGPSGRRPGQYVSDLVADRAAIEVLHAAGVRVLSEESGLDPGEGAVAVLDPIDGSTNASLALPWFATSICVVDRGAPVAAVVHDHASGARFAATRGGGATRDGSPLARREPVGLSDAIIAVNGVPGGHGGWAQFRCFGAAALDLCAVAEGRFDGYIDFADDGHGPWDYLGGLLVCREVGVEVLDARDRELVVLDPEVRRAPVAGPTGLVEELVGVRAALTHGDRS